MNERHPDPMIQFLIKQAEWFEYYDLEELRKRELAIAEAEEYEPTEEDEKEYEEWFKDDICSFSC
jgi:hypothetical protein